MGKVLSSPAPPGRWVTLREHTRVISRECRSTYIVYGPPDEMEVHPADNNEQWFYKHIQSVGNNVTIEFGQRRVRR